jgi:hypothetical protein
MKADKSPWLGLKTIEFIFILTPPLLATLLVWLFKDYFLETNEVTTLWWIILVVGIDVAHVYATLYRTYWDAELFKSNRNLFIYTPLICLITGVLLYTIDSLLFWRILAYLAVYHFMRQQYGLMRLYSRKEQGNIWSSSLDTLMIYAAVIYPILFWHTHTNRNFNWFVEGDFFSIPIPILAVIFEYIYASILVIWVIFTIYNTIKIKTINTPKTLVIIGTILSWYTGIVAFNGDLIFTCLNIIAHGIPYMALIWIYGYKQYRHSSLTTQNIVALVFKPYGIFIFFGIIFLFAYVEEGIWDGLIWHEHLNLFPYFNKINFIEEPLVLNILVPLLSLPQATHYVLDAFIWKIRSPETMPHLLNDKA